MKIKFIKIFAVTMAAFLFMPMPMKIFAHENISEAQTQREYKLKEFSKLSRAERIQRIEELFKNLEKTYTFLNSAKTVQENLEFKTAGAAAFEKAKKFFMIEKDKSREAVFDDVKQNVNEIRIQLTDMLNVGIVEARKAAANRYPEWGPVTSQEIEELKRKEGYYRSLANTFFKKGPAAFAEQIIKNDGISGAMEGYSDDMALSSIFENLLEVDENFRKFYNV